MPVIPAVRIVVLPGPLMVTRLPLFVMPPVSVKPSLRELDDDVIVAPPAPMLIGPA